MGFYYSGKLYSWGDPLSLLRFPKLSLASKLRYGAHVLYAKQIKDWNQLDKINAIPWIKRWIGKQGYEVLWKSLFHHKFYEYQHDLSAAWIAARIQRVAKSRKNLFVESLGYLQGGSDTLLQALEKKIIALGGKIQLNSNVQRVLVQSNKAVGLKIGEQEFAFDKIISTIPLPYIPKLVPDLSIELKNQIQEIKNVGVRCVVLKLDRQFSPYFWMNINDKHMEIPGIIEYSNLNPETGHILYVPYYMPQTHVKYQASDQAYLAEAVHCLSKINPQFNSTWVQASHVARYHYAQTVCATDFFAKLPAMQTPIKHFYMADTSYYYPEDRSIAESLAVGSKLASITIANQ